MKLLTPAFVISTLLAATGAAHAQMKAPDTYVGAAIGARTHYDLDCTGSDPCDRKAGSSGKVYLGRNFTPNLGAEVMAFRLGDAKGSIDNGSGLVPGRVRAQGLGLVGVARTEVDAFTFRARLGAAWERGRTQYASGTSATKNSLVPVAGLGVSYAFDKQWALTADWDRIGGRFNKNEKAAINILSLGVAYSF